MSLIDRVRAAAHAFRSIEAGGTGQRWSRGKVLRSPAREITTRRQLAAERAAWLAMNDATAAAIVGAWTSNLVGDGPSIAPRTPDAALREAIGERFDAWWSAADAEGVDDFASLLRRVAHSLVSAGESFLAMEADEAGELVLRSIAPEQVDANLSRPLPDGAQIVAGIELDARGRRTAYWVKDAEDRLGYAVLTPRRVPAEDVIHVFEKSFPGQQRGISWLSPIVTLLDQLSELGDSQLAAANVASLYSALLVNATGSPADDIAPAGGLSPGALVEVPVGFDVKFSAPPPLNGASEFRRDILRSISAGAGLPYEFVAGDLSQVNFSSARLGLYEFRRRVDTIRKTLITARLIEPVWTRWIALEALHGRIAPSVAASLPVTVAWPGWASIDPKAETEADTLAISAGLASRHEVVARRGRDPREVDAELAADTFIPKENKT